MAVPEESTAQRVSIDPDTDAAVSWKLKLKPDLRPRRAPAFGSKGYR
jgi:hypothetical protein